MINKEAIIQPFLYALFNKNITNNAYIPELSCTVINIHTTLLPDKKNPYYSIPFIPSANNMWILAFNDLSYRYSIYFIGGFDTLKSIQLLSYNNYFLFIFDDNIFYKTNSLEGITCQSELRNQIILKNVTADFKEYPLISSIKKAVSNLDIIKAILYHFNNNCTKCTYTSLINKIQENIQDKYGCISIQALADMSGYSIRHTNRMFTKAFGYGPKEYCELIRFRRALLEIMTNPLRNNSDFIKNSGYADQAHFQREFKLFTGITPKQFIQLLIKQKF